jgi:hypothetical protein
MLQLFLSLAMKDVACDHTWCRVLDMQNCGMICCIQESHPGEEGHLDGGVAPKAAQQHHARRRAHLSGLPGVPSGEWGRPGLILVPLLPAHVASRLQW